MTRQPDLLLAACARRGISLRPAPAGEYMIYVGWPGEVRDLPLRAAIASVKSELLELLRTPVTDPNSPVWRLLVGVWSPEETVWWALLAERVGQFEAYARVHRALLRRELQPTEQRP